MSLKSLQHAIEYSKTLSETQNHGKSFHGVVPDLLIETPHPVFSVSLSSENSLLTVGRQNGVLDVVSIRSKKVLKQFTAVSPNGPDSLLPIISSKFTSNNNDILVACCSGEIFCCNASTGSKQTVVNGDQLSSLMSMDVSTTNVPRVVAGYKDGHICVFDVNRNQALKVISNSSSQRDNGDNGHSMRVTAVRWIPSGYDNILVSAGWDSLVKVWDIRLATPLVKQFSGAKIYGEGLDVKDRIILAACWSKTEQLQIFDLGSSRRLMTATSPFSCDYFYTGRILSTMESETGGKINLITAVGGCGGVLSVLGIVDDSEEQASEDSFSVSSLATFAPDVPAGGKTVAINCLDAKPCANSTSLVTLGLNDGRCFVCKLI